MPMLRLLDDTHSKFRANSGTASGAAGATGAPDCPIERRATLQDFPLARQIALHADWAVSGPFKMQTRINSKRTVGAPPAQGNHTQADGAATRIVHELIESAPPESIAIPRLDHTADVTKEQADGKLVAMIGAGANDAPALAAPGRNGATNEKSGGAIPPWILMPLRTGRPRPFRRRRTS
jgi:hypothetical protein